MIKKGDPILIISSYPDYQLNKLEIDVAIELGLNAYKQDTRRRFTESLDEKLLHVVVTELSNAYVFGFVNAQEALGSYALNGREYLLAVLIKLYEYSNTSEPNTETDLNNNPLEMKLATSISSLIDSNKILRRIYYSGAVSKSSIGTAGNQGSINAAGIRNELRRVRDLLNHLSWPPK